jgi:hypothetical protein
VAIGLELLADFGDRAAALRNKPGFLGNGTNWIDAAIDIIGPTLMVKRRAQLILIG